MSRKYLDKDGRSLKLKSRVTRKDDGRSATVVELIEDNNPDEPDLAVIAYEGDSVSTDIVPTSIVTSSSSPPNPDGSVPNPDRPTMPPEPEPTPTPTKPGKGPKK